MVIRGEQLQLTRDEYSDENGTTASLSGRQGDATFGHPDPHMGIQEPNPKNEMHVRALGSPGNSYFAHMILSVRPFCTQVC